MERSSRRELVELIDIQKDKLRRYEVRLRDLVLAYKSLQNEKKALEASFKALTGDVTSTPASSAAAATSTTHKSQDSNTESNKAAENTENTVLNDPLGVSATQQAEGANDVSNEEEITKQLTALKATLKTVLEEKSKMESVFLADKKLLTNEKESLIQQLNDEKQKHQESKKQAEQQIQELKSKIRDQQNARERELQDHALMLRELQRILSEERAAKEKLENELDEAKKKIQEANALKQREEQEKLVENLYGELKRLKERLKDSERKNEHPSPLLLELQREMAEMKEQHRIAVQQEQQRADEAEKKLRSLAAVSEERVASLEAHLSELSEMIGNYDRLRNQDQVSIQKLKERLTQLDLENAALAHAVGEDKVASSLGAGDEDSNLDVQTLMDRITKMKRLLKVANQRSEHPIDLSAFFTSEDDEDPHLKCQEELNQLKEEFERYKLRAQSVLKGKNVKDGGVSKELEQLREQVTDLKDKLQIVKLQLDNSEKRNKMAEVQYSNTVQQLKNQHKQELASIESIYKTKFAEMEQQMQKQRERTLSLLEEKDQEIELLKNLSSSSSSFLFQSGQSKETVNTAEATKDGSSDLKDPTEDEELIKPSKSEIDKLTQMLSSKGGKWKTQILYYAQELARKDVEITSLRQSKHEIESALRELQQVTSFKEETYVDEIDALKARIQRLEYGQSEKGLNMEYLKNVVLQYMLCRDSSGRRHMLNAIATVLHFTHKELEKVRQANQITR